MSVLIRNNTSLLLPFSFVLFLIYYPARKKVSEELDRTTRSKEWTLSLIIAHVVGGHFFIALLVTIYMLAFVGGPENPWTSGWASFLGITSVVLATIQYVPQIIRTFKRKVRQTVFFLSISLSKI